MTATLVDSNVILDVVSNDTVWFDWSSRALGDCADRGALLVNPLVYAEVSVGFERIEELERNALAARPRPRAAGSPRQNPAQRSTPRGPCRRS